MENNTKRPTTNNRNGKKAKRESFATNSGHALTPNENKFIDEYIKTGNGRKSYMEAYPNASASSAAQLAQRVLNKDYVSEEINFRLEKAKNESIADATEILQYFTSVMRGEIQDQFGLEAPLGERTKAAQELARRMIDIPNKLNGNEAPEVRIVLDWSREKPNEGEEST